MASGHFDFRALEEAERKDGKEKNTTDGENPEPSPKTAVTQKKVCILLPPGPINPTGVGYNVSLESSDEEEDVTVQHKDQTAASSTEYDKKFEPTTTAGELPSPENKAEKEEGGMESKDPSPPVELSSAGGRGSQEGETVILKPAPQAEIPMILVAHPKRKAVPTTTTDKVAPRYPTDNNLSIDSPIRMTAVLVHEDFTIRAGDIYLEYLDIDNYQFRSFETMIGQYHRSTLAYDEEKNRQCVQYITDAVRWGINRNTRWFRKTFWGGQIDTWHVLQDLFWDVMSHFAGLSHQVKKESDGSYTWHAGHQSRNPKTVFQVAQLIGEHVSVIVPIESQWTNHWPVGEKRENPWSPHGT